MNDTIRIGIVGAGFGVSSHLPALLAHPRFSVVALASPKSAERVARERGIAAWFPSCEAMLAGSELDAVAVASPPFAHERDVLHALSAGKHVMCEKPFGRTVEEARSMVAAARTAGTACGIAHEFRFVPQARALEQMVANHHLDPVRNVEITYLRRMLHREGTRSRGWWFERQRGGGLAGAIMSHIVDYANWVMGTAPKHTAGFLRTANVRRRDERGEFESSVDDGAFALLEYDDGRIARLTADATTAVDSYTLAVHGEDRTAVASGPNMTQLTLFAVGTEDTDELQCKPSPYARFESINPNVPLLMELYDEFVKQIDGEPNLLPTFEQGLATQEVLRAIGYEN